MAPAEQNIYTCPMHPEIQQPGPGRCPMCGMALVKASDVAAHHHETTADSSYRPLAIILGLIAVAVIVLSLHDAMDAAFSWQKSAAYFMAGFFLVFSGFKLLDLPGFAEGYATYDLLAQKWRGYGHIYPFIELSLGLTLAIGLTAPVVNLITLILMTFSGLGVARQLLRHQKFQCACLGTFLKVPLTEITLVEDFGMAAMALAMLLIQ